MEGHLRGHTAAAIDWEATFDGIRWYSLSGSLRLTTYPAFDISIGGNLFERFAGEVVEQTRIVPSTSCSSALEDPLGYLGARKLKLGPPYLHT